MSLASACVVVTLAFFLLLGWLAWVGGKRKGGDDE